jgi:hypothetical protein
MTDQMNAVLCLRSDGDSVDVMDVRIISGRVANEGFYVMDYSGTVWVTNDFWSHAVTVPEWRRVCKCPERESSMVAMIVYETTGNVLVAYADGVALTYDVLREKWRESITWELDKRLLGLEEES